MGQLRLFLADDHPVVLAGISTLLKADPEIIVVGEATTGCEALTQICKAVPDVALIDVSMPGLNGLELTRRMAADCPGVRVLILTVHEDAAYVQPILQAGARGYILKRSAADDLLRAVRAVASGGVYLDPAVARQAISTSGRHKDDAATGGGHEPLSAREEEVLRFVAQGLSNKEIARNLDLSVKSVETYRARAADKLDLKARSEIIRYALAHGWLDDLHWQPENG